MGVYRKHRKSPGETAKRKSGENPEQSCFCMEIRLLEATIVVCFWQLLLKSEILLKVAASHIVHVLIMEMEIVVLADRLGD